MRHIWNLFSGPILYLGPIYRDRTGEFGFKETAVITRSQGRGLSLFAFLTGHLSLPPVEHITTMFESAMRHIVCA